MLFWIALFFIIAVVAGVLGFTGIAAAAAGVAKILFYIFIALFIFALIYAAMKPQRGPKP